MKILIVANIHRPLHNAWAGGMELSSLELISGLLLNRHHQLEISVLAHPDTELPHNATLIPCKPIACDDRYARFGGGKDKWNALAIESAISKSLSRIANFDILLDQSSAMAPAFFCTSNHIPIVKTVRLMPFHPSLALTRTRTTTFVHLTDYSKLAVTDVTCRDAVIRDCVEIPHDFETFHPQGSGTYVVSIGRVESRKGHHLAAHFARKCDLTLKVIGPIVNVDYAEHLLSFDNVELVGELDRYKTLSFLRYAAFLLWLPPVPEPNGRVVVEALRLRVPVIGSNTGLMADFITQGLATRHESGYLCAERLPSWWPLTPDVVAAQYITLFAELLDGF